MPTPYTLPEYRAQVAEYERTLAALKKRVTEFERLGRERSPVAVPRLCGHAETVMLRLASPQEHRVEDHRKKLCEDCVADVVRRQCREAVRLGLPGLSGSLRQVSWAYDLRKRAIERHGLPAVRAAVTVKKDATWWIENRLRLPHLKVFKEVEAKLTPQDHLDLRWYADADFSTLLADLTL